MESSMRRAVLVVAGAALLCAAPASAQSETCQPGDEMCIGKQKLVERTSAECRRASDTVPTHPASDEDCHVAGGRRVVRAEIDAYRASWIHRALTFQYRIANDVGFANAPWVGTHNSYNSTSEFPTLSHTDSNQQLSLLDQLRMDVRSLEIDVHWWPSPRNTDPVTSVRAPVVCHAAEQNGVHVGCTGERLLGEVLADVAGWLNDPANRDQVILLYLEDHLEGNHAQARAVLARTLTRTGQPDGSLIYRAGPDDATCRTLPLDLTRQQVLDAGAQVVIVSGCGNGWNSAVFSWPERGGDPADDVRFERRPMGYIASGCGGVDRATYDSLLVRFFEDSTFVTPASGAPADDGITPAVAEAMTACGVDLLGLDQVLPFDSRMEKLVWSWAPEEPRVANGACAFQASGGRWAMGACARPRPAACRLASGRWAVSSAVPFDGAELACADAGGRFDLPRTGYDNGQLRVAAGAGTGDVWVRHREGAPPRGGRPDRPPRGRGASRRPQDAGPDGTR